MDLRTVEQSIDILRLAAVATQQSMIPENPQVARLRDRFVRRLRHFVRIRQAFLHTRIQQLGQLFGDRSPAAAGQSRTSASSPSSIGSRS